MNKQVNYVLHIYDVEPVTDGVYIFMYTKLKISSFRTGGMKFQPNNCQNNGP